MLLIDIGNSRIKWGRWSSGQLQPQGSINWHHDELECSFDREWNNMPIPARIIVSNVTGHAIADRLSCWTEKRWAVTPKFVSVQAQAFGVRNGYTDPKQLGIDRWLALI
ncbi:MAG TPA: type III pantothenate kinase, partial [Gammaproteobacteria bacterium]|nr:type III pantothenate kinase [Gammaproteobacteria bacterium]